MRLLHDWLPTAWYWLLLVVEILAAGGALLHVLLRKNDPRAAGYWVALIALVPLLGAALYLLLGINIIRRSGRHYREALAQITEQDSSHIHCLLPEWETEVQALPGLAQSLKRLSRFTLVGGNQIDPLHNGDEALPAMMASIAAAKRTIALSSYIFEAEGIGSELITALGSAAARGVVVCVLIDAAGTRYGKAAAPALEKLGVHVRTFSPPGMLRRLLTMNLRNHRKLLIVDGWEGFTGGLNIRPGNMLRDNPSHPVRDMHFRLLGPVVAQLQRVFAEDWHFATGEWLDARWFPTLDMHGDVSAVGLADGPDDDTQSISLSIANALNEAKREVRILTPYFLPPEPVFSALIACSLRGVKVRIITPSGTANNLPFVHWASRTMYAPLMKHGCQIYESTAPFDHSKIMTVDGLFSMIGSANLDPRSLKLNFEFNLACFDDHLTRALNVSFEEKLRGSTLVTSEMLDSHTLPERLRNGIARLFVPLL